MAGSFTSNAPFRSLLLNFVSILLLFILLTYASSLSYWVILLIICLFSWCCNCNCFFSYSILVFWCWFLIFPSFLDDVQYASLLFGVLLLIICDFHCCRNCVLAFFLLLFDCVLIHVFLLHAFLFMHFFLIPVIIQYLFSYCGCLFLVDCILVVCFFVASKLC